MKNFRWDLFRAALMMSGMKIKDWLTANDIDRDRFYNIKSGKTKPTEDEYLKFMSVVTWAESLIKEETE